MKKRQWISGVLSVVIAGSFYVFPQATNAAEVNLTQKRMDLKQYKNPKLLKQNKKQSVSLLEDEATSNVYRMAGADRFETSAKVAKEMPIDSDAVVIATGTNFPDALSGGPLAAWEGAPILLTKAAGLSTVVKDEITRRGATRAILLGSTGVISANVETELKALGIKTIKRLAGADRYETSAKIADELLTLQDQALGEHSKSAFVVTGTNYADALAASSPAGFYGEPILLVKGGAVTTPIKQVVGSKGMDFFTFVGGTDVVPVAVEQQLADAASVEEILIDRLAGSTRYETALEVAKAFTDPAYTGDGFQMNNQIFHVSFGGNYPDALAQGPLASFMGAPLLLTKTASLEASVNSFLTKTGPVEYYISGGADVVSENVANQLKATIKP